MDREKRLKRQKEFLVQTAYWIVWVCIAALLIKYVGSVLLPFAAAFAAAWVLSFPVAYVSARLHVKRSIVSVLTVVLFYGLLAGLLYLLGSRIAALVQDIFIDVTAFVSDMLLLVPPELVNQTKETLPQVSERVISGVSDMASNIPSLCMNILLTMIATVFTELEFPEILAFIGRQIPEDWQETVTEIRAYTAGMIGKCMLSYLLIMLVTFAELVVGFLLLRIEGAFAIAFIIAVLDILPVLGTGTILLPWMIIAFVAGNPKQGIGLLTLYLLITVVRNIIEPRLVGSQMGLSPVVMLPCMILGLHFFGLCGMFLMPYGAAFVKSLNDRGVIHIFKMEEKDVGC